MSLRQRLSKYLVDNGLFQKEADAILVKLIEQYPDTKLDSAVGGSGYPESFVTIMTVAVKRTTAEWLAANKPMHWARPMFEENLNAEDHIKSIFSNLN